MLLIILVFLIAQKNGGEIGWVKETLLSDKLNKILVRMKRGQITKPIKYPNGYLLIKINDKKDLKEKINIENELKELIQYESGSNLINIHCFSIRN